MLCLWVMLIMAALRGEAHPDLLEQIAGITRQVATRGETPELLLQRADLYRRHGQYTEALIDLNRFESLSTNSPRRWLERAQVLCDAARPSDALLEIEPLLQQDPRHLGGLIIRGRSHAQLGQHETAVADFTAAIAGAAKASPDLYVARAHAQAALGRFDEAVRGLDEAFTNGVSGPALTMAAIQYDRQRGAFDSALVRVDDLVTRYPVKEPWLTLQAEILEQANRNREAETTFQKVIAGIEQYSALRRGLEMTKQLESRARQGLARVQNKTSTASKL